MKKIPRVGRCNSIGTHFMSAIGCTGTGTLQRVSNTLVSATRTARTPIYACDNCAAFKAREREIWDSTPDGPQGWAKREAVQKFFRDTLAGVKR